MRKAVIPGVQHCFLLQGNDKKIKRLKINLPLSNHCMMSTCTESIQCINKYYCLSIKIMEKSCIIVNNLNDGPW